MHRLRRYSLDEYEAEHRHPVNRAAHAVGIPVVALSLAALLAPRRRFGWSRRTALAGLAAGWGLLWAGHAVEGNRPAVLRHPAAALTALTWWRSRAVRQSNARIRSDDGIPRDRQLDSTLGFLREGYTFIGTRCRRYGTDAFEARLMFRRVICMLGEEAARTFYTPGRFTRRRAVPASALMLLQDFGSVQTLDGDSHRHRKQMFMSLLTGGAVQDLAQLVTAEWDARLDEWARRPRVVLHDEVRWILCRAICTWAGVPLSDHDVAQRTREFGAMIDGAGAVGPQNWRALALRHRTERWIRHVIDDIRSGKDPAPDGSAAHTIAWHRDPDGRVLPARVAAVELINVLRPTVAVARFITFAALALHEHPGAAQRLRQDRDVMLEPFVQEVRRFYPFFPAVGGRATGAFEWRGHRFEEGDWVLLDLYGTNHDPRTWGDPESFRPERFQRWDRSPYNFIPQGGGEYATGHRCPGEAVTIALTRAAVRMLTEAMRYDVPPQDLRIRMTDLPALPSSGFVMHDVRRA